MVSVVIPVYNDAAPLRRCLRALEEQTYPEMRYRVNVVDNASDENIGAVVEDFRCARLLSEANRGSYTARNRGIRESEGEIIAFTDADCIPRKTWIEQGVCRLTGESACELVGGRIDFYYQIPNRPNPPEFFDKTHYLNQKAYVREENFAATANAFTWKRLFAEVGPFDDTLRSGGDTEWGRRVKESGGEICYAEGARVRHPARYTYRGLRKKKLRILGGTVRSRNRRGYPLRELVVHLVKDVGHHVKFALTTSINEPYNWKEKARCLVAFPIQGMYTAAERVRLWFRGAT